MYLYQYETDYFNNFTQYRAMKYLWCSVTPFIVLLGTYGNIMVLVVLGKQTRTVSTYVYLVALAVCDEIMLVLSFAAKWPKHTFGFDILCVHIVVCRLYVFINFATSHLSVWLIVAVTMERLCVVVRPLHAHSYVSVHRACIAVSVITILSLCFNAHYLVTLTIRETNITGKADELIEVYRFCEFKPFYQPILQIPLAWLDACLYSYFPFFCIIVANTLIIRRLRSAHRRRKEMTQELPLTRRHSPKVNGLCSFGRRANPNCRSTALDRSMQRTIMLLVVSFVFLITTMPVLILNTVTATLSSANRNVWTNGVEFANFNLIDVLVQLLMMINHSCNFFLYCVAGAKFRKDFMRRCPMCCKSKERQRQQEIVSRPNTVIKSDYEISTALVLTST